MPHASLLTRRAFAFGAALSPTVLLAATPTAAHQQGTPMAAPAMFESTFERLSSWLEATMSDMGIPGAAIGVVHGSEMNAIGLGVASVETRAPVDPTTVFRIASLSKIFTASGIVALAGETGRDLTAPIATWYPDFAVADPVVTEAATITDLLSHSAGWADPYWPDEPDPATDSLDHHVRALATALQITAPGTHLNYSNSSFLLAGHILATLDDESFERALANRVLQPLGLKNTGFGPDDFGDLVVANGHVPTEDGLSPIDPWQVPVAANPERGLLSTVDDLLDVVRYHAGISTPSTDPLPNCGRLLMQVPHGPGGSIGTALVDNIGLGWMLSTVGGKQVVMSQGSDSGQAAAMAFVPDEQFGIVCFANADSGLFAANAAILEALDLFLEAKQPELTPIGLTANALAAIQGNYAIPNDLAFDVSTGESGPQIATSAGDEPVAELSGPLHMLDASHGFVEKSEGPVFVDFERDDQDSIRWLRFAGRLAPRT